MAKKLERKISLVSRFIIHGANTSGISLKETLIWKPALRFSMYTLSSMEIVYIDDYVSEQISIITRVVTY